MPSTPDLQVQGVRKGFWRGGSYLGVLQDVSLEVAAGEVVAVVGRRLGGKSTLLEIVAGIEAPDEGTVTLAGRAVRAQGRPAIRGLWGLRGTRGADPLLGRDLVFVSREGPHQELDVSKYIGGPLAIHGQRNRDVQRLAGTALERVGATELAGRRWGELSNYQRALVGLARAFAGTPQFVILDDLLDAHDRRDTETLSDTLHNLLEDSDRPCGVLLSAGYYETAVVLANRVCSLTPQGTLVHASGPKPDDAPIATILPLHKPADRGMAAE